VSGANVNFIMCSRTKEYCLDVKIVNRNIYTIYCCLNYAINVQYCKFSLYCGRNELFCLNTILEQSYSLIVLFFSLFNNINCTRGYNNTLI